MFKVMIRYLKTYTKDIGSFISLVVSPIIFILILGMALGGNMGVSDFDVKVLLLSDESQLSEALIETFENADIEVVKVSEEPSSDELRHYSAIVRTKDEVSITKSSYRKTSAGIVSQVLNEFLIAYDALSINPDIEFKEVSENILVNSRDFHSIAPTAMEYYSVTMLAMVLMYSLGYGTSLMSYEIRDYRGLRLRVAPIPQWQTFLGISLSVMILMLVQGYVIVFFSKFVYGARWTDNYLILTLMIAGFSLIGSNIGMIIASIVQDENKANSMVNMLVPALTAASGGYFKIDSSSEIFLMVQKFIPNFRFHEMAFALNFTGAAEPIRISMIYMVILVVLSTLGLMYQVKQVAK
ncbi:ABC transporter permease [Acidaminobacter sp. JC074]|uniref:ABC transporter permease n=1 Tax=Acidaminobacter sp. JC074 TaxID=2530199 RepID=UPI001F10FEBD|nr:ABC transporter permease [Acidaminobacter sp. JC074]MCH4887182.1 ABC transporter permease [Acidaminobacter sp. JC074]